MYQRVLCEEIGDSANGMTGFSQKNLYKEIHTEKRERSFTKKIFAVKQESRGRKV